MTNTITTVKYVGPEGDKERALVMIVGEAPGEVEERKGRPFVGKSGELLREILCNALGPDYELDVYITNVVKVRPSDNRTPTSDEITSWLPVLEKEVSGFAGLILATGKTAQTALKQLGYDYSPSNCEHIYHPAYILRQGDEATKQYKKDTELLIRAGV